MKKMTYKWLSIFAMLLLFVGCGLFGRDEDENGNGDGADEPIEQPAPDNGDTDPDPSEDPDDADQVTQDLAAWMPRLNNVVYSYEGVGNEFASFTWNPQFNAEDYYQLVLNNGGTVMAEVYEYANDEVVRTFTRPETYFRDNFTEIGSVVSASDAEVVLRTPIAVGTSWTNGDVTYEITAVAEEITVPLDTYETIEVTLTYPDTIIRRYYAEDVGLVYEVSETEDLMIESKLSDIQTNTPEVLHLTVYQGDDQALGLDQLEAEITLETNDPARLALQELFRGEAAGYGEVFLLPEATEINYLFINNAGVVEVDLSSEYVTNMNAGSAGEVLFLAGLTNTLLRYYGAEELLLTIDGGNYESGHIILEAGETLTFNEEILNP